MRVLALHDIWLLRLRALLARAHGCDKARLGVREQQRRRMRSEPRMSTWPETFAVPKLGNLLRI
jgi:hypothetical protein